MSAIFQWYLDQIILYPGLLILILLSVVVIRSIRSHKHKLPLRLRVLLYSALVSSILLLFACISVNVSLLLFKQIAPTWNQKTICFVNYVAVTLLGATTFMSVINLFFERLCLSFHETTLEVSKCTRYSFRIILNGSWCIVGVLYLFSIDPMPYNIYSGQVEESNGVTCSTHIKGADIKLTFLFALFAFIISTSNLVILALFMRKLYILITDKHMKNISAEFVCYMKEITMLIGIAVFASVVLWTLQAIFQYGHVCAVIDFVVTAIVMFLTFRKLSDYYFILLRCDKLTRCCCKPFEKNMSSISCISKEPKCARMDSDEHEAPTTFTVTTTTAMYTWKDDKGSSTMV
eukprot:351420_1